MRVRPRKSWGPTRNSKRALLPGVAFGWLVSAGCMTSYVVTSAESKGGTFEGVSTTPKSQESNKTTKSPDTSSASTEISSSEPTEQSTPEGTTSSSPDTLPACPGKKIRCGLLCVDVRNDAQHCGGCFVGCATPASCVFGQCLASCDQGCAADEECNGDNLCACRDAKTHCGAECVDMGTNSAHCGACGQACGPSQICVAGQCRS